VSVEIVGLMHYQDEGVGERDTTTTCDLDHVESLEGTKGPCRLRLYSFKLKIPRNLPLASVKAGDTVYRISIEGRDAPLRSVSFQEESDLGVVFSIRFMAHLTDATVEVMKRSHDSQTLCNEKGS
jgi:hypothetical protein